MDPLSITASVITVAGLAYKSTKALYEAIETIKDAPEFFETLNKDVKGLNNVLKAILEVIEDKEKAASLPAAQVTCLKALELPLQNCHEASDAFKAKIEKFTAHSSESHTSKRDRIHLHFKKDEIESLRYNLGSYKERSVAIWKNIPHC